VFDPSLGRWITEDPIGFGGDDENLYRFVGNSPINNSDPTGLMKKPAAIAPVPKNKSPFDKNDDQIRSLLKRLGDEQPAIDKIEKQIENLMKFPRININPRIGNVTCPVFNLNELIIQLRIQLAVQKKVH
jgi:hypothetical protein